MKNTKTLPSNLDIDFCIHLIKTGYEWNPIIEWHFDLVCEIYNITPQPTEYELWCDKMGVPRGYSGPFPIKK